MQPRLSRRTAIRATGGLSLGIATGSLLATNAAAGNHTFARQLNTVRASTRKYRDVATAQADGYERLGAFKFVGVFFNNADFIGNTDLTDPPSNLFYAPNRSRETEDSDLILAGLEYHVRGDHGKDQNIFADEEASRRLKVSEAEGWHANPFGAPITGLHVWAHLENTDGVFALEHPTIRDRLAD